MKHFCSLSILLSILVAPFGMAFAQSISFDSDIRYKKLEDSNFVELKADQKLKLKKGENALILAKFSIPILVYSPMDESSVLKFNQANFQELMQEQMQESLNTATNELIEGIRKTEALLQKRDFPQALTTISELKNKYPKVSEVLFLSGTVQYLSNNKTAATDDLTAGLALDPKNSSAQKLLKKMAGGLQ